MSTGRNLVFRPFTFLYFSLLAFLFIIIVPISFTLFRELLTQGIGIPPEFVGGVLLLSLIGSYINIPLTTIRSTTPVYTITEVRRWMVTWRIPVVSMGEKKTLVTINFGGAIIPILISTYLLIFNIPNCSLNIPLSYGKILVLLIVVSITTNRSARLVKGLGIATPAFGPPIVTALTTLLIDLISPTQCPTQIAYIGGTLGVLVGADLMNLNRISNLGAPVVSIGGAGTFDGVYLTGLLSVILVLLLL